MPYQNQKVPQKVTKKIDTKIPTSFIRKTSRMIPMTWSWPMTLLLCKQETNPDGITVKTKREVILRMWVQDCLILQ